MLIIEVHVFRSYLKKHEMQMISINQKINQLNLRIVLKLMDRYLG